MPPRGHFRTPFPWLVVVAALLALLNSSCTTTQRDSAQKRGPDTDSTPPALLTSTLRDLHGQLCHSPLVATHSVGVLIFTTHDCPIANGYTPTLLRLMQRWQPRGVTFSLFYVGSDLGTARQHHADFAFPCSAFLDADLRWARRLEITRTPECIVLESGKVRYRGRIDDTYRDLGQRANQATRADLDLAIDQVVRGQAVTVPRTEAIGCPIPWQPETSSSTKNRPS